MSDLFAYGSLMCPEIMLRVSGCLLASTPAMLTGYRRCRVKGEAYPGLLPVPASAVSEPGSPVEGVIYHAITPVIWQRLDQFEGEMYQRQTVALQLPDGRSVTADTYLVRAAFLSLLTPEPWDFATFLRRDKADFMAAYLD